MEELQMGSGRSRNAWWIAVGVLAAMVVAVVGVLGVVAVNRHAPAAAAESEVDPVANFEQIISMVGDDRVQEAWTLFHCTTMTGDVSAEALEAFSTECFARSLGIQEQLDQLAGTGPAPTPEMEDELWDVQMQLIQRQVCYDGMREQAEKYAELARKGELNEYMDEQIREAAENTPQ